jgi:hypothetical protein
VRRSTSAESVRFNPEGMNSNRASLQFNINISTHAFTGANMLQAQIFTLQEGTKLCKEIRTCQCFLPLAFSAILHIFR